ncbi:hypothetical protein [Bordetella sp. LUAb4]|uniref:hypothetical protein n=1 Tax=Bordetella sp. LUAb4 TaxID=2843195 RepID=UPI001E339881|nr:hypothetical protein [Bordetella sp. LUAb4]
MFSISINAGDAALTIWSDDQLPGATPAANTTVIPLNGKAGTRRAGLNEGPAPKRQAVELMAGITPASVVSLRAPLAGQTVPVPVGAPEGRSAGAAAVFGEAGRKLLASDLQAKLLDSDIDWAALRGHWERDSKGLGPEVQKLKDEYETLAAEALAIAQLTVDDDAGILARIQEVEQGLQKKMRRLRDRHLNVVQARLFDNKTKSLVTGKNRELWMRFQLALEGLMKRPGRKAAEAALDIASDGMANWEESMRNWEHWVQWPGPDGLSFDVSKRDTPDIAVIPRKAELVQEAYELETIRLRSAIYVQVKPLHRSAVGKRALARGKPLLHSRKTVTDTSTNTTWFEMMSVDRKRPNHYYANDFFRGIIRLRDYERQQNTKEYSLSDVVLYQLLSLEAQIDPAEISMIELVHVDNDLIRWVSEHASAYKGLDVGNGIPWQDIPVDLFIEETEQGRVVRELAHALGKEVRHVWSFDYLPHAWGGPVPEGEPATASAEGVRLDVLAFIAPALR